jgi:cytohesin
MKQSYWIGLLLYLSLSVFFLIYFIAMEDPILDATSAGNVEQVRQLIAKGADVNAIRVINGSTPLHLAASNGHKDVAKLLIAKGADVNAKGGDRSLSFTPLHKAADKSHKDVAELLKKHGAKE